MSSNIISSMGFVNTKQTLVQDAANPKIEALDTKESIAQNQKVKAEEIKQEEANLEQATEITAKEISEAIEVVSAFINQPPRNVNFIEDIDSGKTVIKVFDNSSKELIKQFPSEELISIAQKIRALHQQVGEQAGIFLDTSV